MDEILFDCQANFGDAPRSFSLWDRLTYLRMPRPLWLRANPTDDLRLLFKHLPKLLTSGVVIWGHIIQANRLLFSHGTADCPGEFVYCLDDPRTVDVVDLVNAAMQIGSLKGTRPRDPKLRPIAEHLTNEYTRVFGLPVPSSFCPYGRYQISTTQFFRKHLPRRKICKPLLPLIVSRRKPRVVLPLPERYWPEEFVEWWVQPF